MLVASDRLLEEHERHRLGSGQGRLTQGDRAAMTWKSKRPVFHNTYPSETIP